MRLRYNYRLTILLSAVCGLALAAALLTVTFVVADALEPSKDNCLPLGDSMAREMHYALVFENGKAMKRPMRATFIEIYGGLGRYSDSDTTCRLLASVTRSKVTRTYTNAERTLVVTVGPGDAVRVLYLSSGTLLSRQTALAY